mgnify:CR=1 FL=1
MVKVLTTEEYSKAEAAIDAAIEEEEIKKERKTGVCRYCGQNKEDCTGYKCWIR